MKNRICSIMGMLLLGIFMACSSDEGELSNSSPMPMTGYGSDEIEYAQSEGQTSAQEPVFIKSVSDMTGTVIYCEPLDCWYISYVVPNTIDSVLDFFPSSLDDSLKQENLKVQFSGDLYEVLNEDILAYFGLGGTELYSISLTFIRTY